MKNTRLYALLALMLMAGGVTMQAQTQSYFTYEDASFRYIEGGPCLEVGSDNGESHFFLVSAFDFSFEWFTYEQEHNTPARILKLSPNMELLGEMVMGEEGRRSTVTSIYPDPENDAQFIAVGKIHDNELHYDRPFIVRFDGDLNILWQKEVELPHNCCKYFFKPKSFMDSQHDIVYMTEFYGSENQMNHPYLYLRFSTEGDVLAIDSTATTLFDKGGIFEYQDGSGDYGVCNSQWCYIQRLNRDFEPVERRNLVQNIHLDDQHEILDIVRYDLSTVLSLSDSSLVIAVNGWGWFYPETVPDAAALMKLCPADTTSNINVWEFNDVLLSDCYDVYTEAVPDIKSVDRLGDYLFFCYCIYEYDGSMVGNSRLCVTKLDLGFDVIWQRTYSFDNKLFPRYLMATQDGGCLVTGEVGTGLDGAEGMMMFAVKIDSEGYLDVPEMGNVTQSVGCYPNPAKNFVRIEDLEPSEVQVYNALGQLVKTVKDSNEINVSGLPEGVYLLRITDAEGKIYTNKITKR